MAPPILPNEVIQYNYEFYLVGSTYFGYDLDTISLKFKVFPFKDTQILPLDVSIFRKGREEYKSEVFQEYLEFCLIGHSRHIVSSDIKNILNFNYLEYTNRYNSKKRELMASNLNNKEDLLYRLNCLYRFNIESICIFLGLLEHKLKKDSHIVNGVINRLNLKIKNETSKQ